MRETIQNTNGKQFHAVSLSGGKDSTAMLLLMIERDMPINMVLSADTGMEFPEMYEHLAKLDEHLFRERGIHITTLRHPKGFEYGPASAFAYRLGGSFPLLSEWVVPNSTSYYALSGRAPLVLEMRALTNFRMSASVLMSGKRLALLPAPPLRTVRDSFPSYGSSLS